MLFCSCGAPARVRFSRTRPDGRFTRTDRCGDCGDEFLMQLNAEEFVVWQVAEITEALLREHAREDRRWVGTRQSDLALMAFGEW